MIEEAHFSIEDRKTLTSVEVKLDRAITDIANLANNFASKTDFADLKQRTDKLEDNNRWIVRLIMGVIITAVLSLVVVNYK